MQGRGYGANDIQSISYAAAQHSHSEAHKGSPENFFVSKDGSRLAVKYPQGITELSIADLQKQAQLKAPEHANRSSSNQTIVLADAGQYSADPSRSTAVSDTRPEKDSLKVSVNNPSGTHDKGQELAKKPDSWLGTTWKNIGETANKAVDFFTPKEPTPQELAKGKELTRIHRAFDTARETGDIAGMQNLQEQYLKATSDNPTPSMLNVPMSTAITRARMDANMPMDKGTIAVAATAAFSTGISGMAPSPKVNFPMRAVKMGPNDGPQLPTKSTTAVHSEGGHQAPAKETKPVALADGPVKGEAREIGAMRVLPKAAEKIDSTMIRALEKGVKEGSTSVPVEAGTQLRAVAEAFRANVSEYAATDTARAQKIMASSLQAVDRLPRFKVLTESAVNEVKTIIRSGLEQ